MNVLFVSDTRIVRTPYRDESTRYRCYHMAEGLHAAGHLADVTTLASLEMANLTRYDVVSVHQPNNNQKLMNVLARCKELDIRTVADLDALEFDPTLAQESPKVNLEESTIETVRAAFMGQSLALQYFDEVSVATEELARARRAIAPNQPVYVAHNGLSNFWLSCNDQIKGPLPGKKRRVGFMSDSLGMNDDFTAAAKALSAFVQSSADNELFIVGPLVIAPDQIPESQVTRGAWMDFMDVPQTLASCWVNVSPHTNNQISYAQPHTKFIEAAAFGIPTISSPIADLARHDVPGLIIAENDEQWLQAFVTLSDKHYYEQCTKALYDYVRDRCLATQSAGVLIEQWSAKHEKPEYENTTRLSAAS